jgi:hypothetical protein
VFVEGKSSIMVRKRLGTLWEDVKEDVVGWKESCGLYRELRNRTPGNDGFATSLSGKLPGFLLLSKA